MFNPGIRDEKISGNHNDFLIEEGHFTIFFLVFCGSSNTLQFSTCPQYSVLFSLEGLR